MSIIRVVSLTIIVLMLIKGPVFAQLIDSPSFRDVSVHDPSVIKVGNTYYVFGSHLASAKTDDLIRWTQISSTVNDNNPLIPNVYTELAETFEWAQTTTLWAPDVVQLQDGRFYMYYCACEGSSPLSALGVAVSDNVEGPYQDMQILLRSGMWGQPSEDGTVYDLDKHPNAVDPQTFFDAGGKLWMVYGSYSGGLFIMSMDPQTGLPFPNQGYGERIMAGRSAIEGAYIQYSPHTGYYYLFASFGGLAADGGYNVRVARSENPDGPYFDPQGNNMIDCYGEGIHTHTAIEPYGAKLVGNFQFLDQNGNPTGIGYVSPGHNSTLYDESSDKYFIFMHARFPGRGEMHQVRVHQMFMNEDGWPVIAPQRYAGENLNETDMASIYGTYSFVNHGRDVSAQIKNSVVVTLNVDGTVTGGVNGQWERSGDNDVRLTVDGIVYTGVAAQQWDEGLGKRVMTISALSSAGTSVWASQLEAHDVQVEDCAGVLGGSAYLDRCGECVGGTTGLEPCMQDCNGDWGGSAYTDDCGICVGGETGILPCAGSVQGEDAGDFDGVTESINEGYTGEGYLNTTNGSGVSASWVFYADEVLTTDLVFRYANGSAEDRPVSVSVNGTGQHASVSMPSTTAWTSWSTVVVPVSFVQGENVITVTSLTEQGAANIDMITYSSDLLNNIATGVAGKAHVRKPVKLTAAENRVLFHLQKSSEVNVYLFSVSGRKLKNLFRGKGKEGYNAIRFEHDLLAPGAYIIQMECSTGEKKSVVYTHSK